MGEVRQVLSRCVRVLARGFLSIRLLVAFRLSLDLCAVLHPRLLALAVKHQSGKCTHRGQLPTWWLTQVKRDTAHYLY